MGVQVIQQENCLKEPWRHLKVLKILKKCTAFAMASGMSAVTLIAELAKPGDNVVITKDVYGGTTRFFSEIMRSRY